VNFPKRIPQRNQAFSLVEVLVVISVIGIIASLALPSITNLSNRSNFAKNERNAQTVASLLAAARAAGATNQWQTVDAAIDDLEEEIVIKLAGEVVAFKMPDFTAEQKAGLTPFLAVDSSKAMVYYAGISSE
jgi:prepilin-type N-terminal cleavage/methylation domain-containing protein